MRSDDLHELLNPILPSGSQITKSSHLTTLWAGYGSIYRIHLITPTSSLSTTYVVKTIRPPSSMSLEYDEGHARKMLSYQVEANFYRDFAPSLADEQGGCCIPKLLSSSAAGARGEQGAIEAQTLVLQDLSVRFPILTEKRGTLSDVQVTKSLEWLASFHARSWNIESTSSQSIASFCPPPSIAFKSWTGKGLWQQGGYHYLATRMQQLSSIHPHHDPWGRLGLHSASILPFAVDYCLSNPQDRSRLSLIHGDVKAANMAFSRDGSSMAMYDFQYVGVGLGVQDLAKFLTTSIPSHYLKRKTGEEELLKTYHNFLVQRLPKGAKYEFADLVTDWQLALVSWVRFLAGWSGGFWGNVDWLQSRVEALLRDDKWVKDVSDRYETRLKGSEQA
ncbi:uncharacterized protein MEPE_02712 [Melanopsichium pennsylvanicum]|uniref:CHK kinase-like domain-containing protein n=2 Tax=Melanopsichium pennsylvanicum TaxID=63383 RepID=A0AAJ4XKG4_9BASI|nr:phosphotransferase enzyme family protein [Melanopsichium pennsylvanicum 4]SNX84004.1 uncharacterized protein MEPE_02712 [Melanopsichium pennsylvanicum]